MDAQYLLRGVGEDEYRALKKDEEAIVKELMGEFNEHWRPQVKDIEVTFRYNTNRRSIGIWYQIPDPKNENAPSGWYLVLDPEDAPKNVDVVVGSLYRKLQQRLDKLKMFSEKWED